MAKNQNYEDDAKDYVLIFSSAHCGWSGSPPSSLLFTILPECRLYTTGRAASLAGREAQCLSHWEQHHRGRVC